MAKNRGTEQGGFSDVIYKYPLGFDDIVDVEMPEGAEVLSVANQHEKLVVYARVSSRQKRTAIRQFRVAGTGHPLELPYGVSCEFVGTALFRGSSFVLHVWDLGEV